MVYALIDGSSRIDVAHLDAAWAVWQYCRASVSSLFGERTGDVVADKLLDAARRAGPDGLTADEQHGALGRHISADRIKMAVELLIANRLATVQQIETGGRPARVLVAQDGEESERSEERAMCNVTNPLQGNRMKVWQGSQSPSSPRTCPTTTLPTAT